MSQAVRFQEILRRLAIIDEGFVEGHAGLGLGLPASRLLDPKTRGAGAGGGAGGDRVTGCLSGMGHHPGARRGRHRDEITGVLLAIAPVAGLGRVNAAVPEWQPSSGLTSRPRW